MTLTTGDGFTLLAGPVVDQAALHGLLHQLRDIGLPLVSVRQPRDRRPTPRRTPPRPHRPQEPDMTITAPTVTVPAARRRRPDAEQRPRRRHLLPAHLRVLDPGPDPARAGAQRRGLRHRRRPATPACCGAACSTPSTPSPRSAPPWPSTRWSSARTARWPSASSTSRLVEAAVVMIGVVSLLAVVTMRQDFAGSGADAASLTVTANALVRRPGLDLPLRPRPDARLQRAAASAPCSTARAWCPASSRPSA